MSDFSPELLRMSRRYRPHRVTVALLIAWTDMGPNNVAESLVREAVRADYRVDVEPETLDEWLAGWQENYRAAQS